MSEAVKELISQAIDQDFTNANKTFNDVMTIKMSDLLDQEQVRLADQIYNGVEPDDADEEDIMGDEDGDQLELDLGTEDESESNGEGEEEELEFEDDEEEELDNEWDDELDDEDLDEDDNEEEQ